MIKYWVARRIRVRLTVYDSTGKTIRQLVDEEKRAGTYEVEFLTAVGSGHLASGEYTYRMEAGEFCCEKSMELVNQPVSRVEGEGEANSDFAGSDDPRASCS